MDYEVIKEIISIEACRVAKPTRQVFLFFYFPPLLRQVSAKYFYDNSNGNLLARIDAAKEYKRICKRLFTKSYKKRKPKKKRFPLLLFN